MSDSEDEGQYEDDDAKFEEILAGAGVGEEENQQEDSSDGEQDIPQYPVHRHHVEEDEPEDDGSTSEDEVHNSSLHVNDFSNIDSTNTNNTNGIDQSTEELPSPHEFKESETVEVTENSFTKEEESPTNITTSTELVVEEDQNEARIENSNAVSFEYFAADPPITKGRDIAAIIAERTAQGAPRLAQPRKPVRKGVKPPTRGEPTAFKLTTKTETEPPPIQPLPSPPPREGPPGLPQAPLPIPNLEDDRPPRPASPHVAKRGPPGLPNFAAEALNVQLKKTAPRKGDTAPPLPPVPPARPNRPQRPERAKTSPESAPEEEKKEEGKQGFLQKRGGFFKSWKKRWCVLKDGKIYYYRNQKLDVLKGIMLDIYKAEKLVKESKEYSFCVFTPKRNYHCAAESAQELDSWIERIQSSIKK